MSLPFSPPPALSYGEHIAWGGVEALPGEAEGMHISCSLLTQDIKRTTYAYVHYLQGEKPLRLLVFLAFSRRNDRVLDGSKHDTVSHK